jgi:hypothetical protein
MSDSADITEAAEAPPKPRGRRILKRVLLWLLGVIVVLGALAAFAYEFGSMEPPSPQMRASYAALVAAGAAKQVPAAGFHVPIPGCICHSTDPYQQVSHAGYTMRTCSRCHSRGAASQGGVGSGQTP